MPTQFLHSFMSQRWEDLLLLHWPIDEGSIKCTLPDDLNVDLFNGQAWLSVVGFKLSGLRISPIRWMPWPAFWEINLRTYVRDRKGNRGIWFYSLDSSDRFAVAGARMLYGLPYNLARTYGYSDSKRISFLSDRRFPHQKAKADFWATFPSSGKKARSVESGLDRFLLERYCFWSRRKFSDHSDSSQVKHRPYDAIRTTESNYSGQLFQSQGFTEPTRKPILGHYCKGFNVRATAPPWLFSIAGQANQR